MLINLYWGLFLSGTTLALLSFIFNGIFDIFNLDFGADAVFLPVRPFFVLIYMTVFGGVGVISSYFLAPIITLVPAITVGFCVAKPLDYLLGTVLKRFETVTSGQVDAIGLKATVIETISSDKTGKIRYSINDNVLTASAKESKHGNGFRKNDTVVIVSAVADMFLVARLGESEIKLEVDAQKPNAEESREDVVMHGGIDEDKVKNLQ